MDFAATLMKSLLAAPCLPGSIGENSAGTGPDCKVTEHYQNENGMLVDKDVPSCADSGDVGPCWNLRQDLPACLHPALRIRPDPNEPALATRASGTTAPSVFLGALVTTSVGCF